MHAARTKLDGSPFLIGRPRAAAAGQIQSRIGETGFNTKLSIFVKHLLVNCALKQSVIGASKELYLHFWVCHSGHLALDPSHLTSQRAFLAFTAGKRMLMTLVIMKAYHSWPLHGGAEGVSVINHMYGSSLGQIALEASYMELDWFLWWRL